MFGGNFIPIQSEAVARITESFDGRFEPDS